MRTAKFLTFHLILSVLSLEFSHQSLYILLLSELPLFPILGDNFELQLINFVEATSLLLVVFNDAWRLHSLF